MATWMVLDIIAEAVRGRSAVPSLPEMAEPQCKQMPPATGLCSSPGTS